MSGTDPGRDVDPRRAFWRRGSYEIVGDWLHPASVSVLDRVTTVTQKSLVGRTVLDLASGTGAVAIEAARRGATVVAVDLTDELVDIARRRASAAGVDVAFEVGDFDRLGEVIGDATFDIVTSAFGLIFAPDPDATLDRLAARVVDGGLVGVTGWDPDSVFAVPPSLFELLPQRPTLALGAWTTELAARCAGTPFEIATTTADDLLIPFDSVPDCAAQLERWSGGWTQLFEHLDALGSGPEARERFHEHLHRFAEPTAEGIDLRARYHASVLCRTGAPSRHQPAT
ncbi:MAG: class I SAM-dependent methyltransferase [Desertimonas sp.]